MGAPLSDRARQSQVNTPQRYESMGTKRRGNEFTRDTKDHLARSVNLDCSKCDCPTSGPRKGTAQSVTIGVAAHISAASPEGCAGARSGQSRQTRRRIALSFP
jgi:hypothetical protein